MICSIINGSMWSWGWMLTSQILVGCIGWQIKALFSSGLISGQSSLFLLSLGSVSGCVGGNLEEGEPRNAMGVHVRGGQGDGVLPPGSLHRHNWCCQSHPSCRYPEVWIIVEPRNNYTLRGQKTLWKDRLSFDTMTLIISQLKICISPFQTQLRSLIQVFSTLVPEEFWSWFMFVLLFLLLFFFCLL